MTLKAAIKPRISPMTERYGSRYLNAIKYPLIEHAKMSNERISKKTFLLSKLFSFANFQRTPAYR
jgi:hypothetical protein